MLNVRLSLLAVLACVAIGRHWLLSSSRGTLFDSHTTTTTTIYNDSHLVLGKDEIPLWPHGHSSIPGERPGVFGNESITCQPGTPLANCTDRRVRNVTRPTLLSFIVPESTAAVIVAPGGGYNLLAIDKEGTDMAAWLNELGISAFVLKYRVPGRSWLPFGAAPLMDAQRAVGIVRNLAGGRQMPHLEASKIGLMGFSAGAHLTGHLNVAWANRTYELVDATDHVSCRPDFSLMVYPWRSVSPPPVNEPLEGASASNVTNTTPPTLLVQTQDDWVHVENSIYYYLALQQHGVVPAELHVYPHGGHGYGRCTIPKPLKFEVCSWPDRAVSFLRLLDVLAPLETEMVRRQPG